MAASSSKAGGDAGTSIKALNKENIVNTYLPTVGTVSYSLLSVNVLNPSLEIGLISKRNLTNALLVGSIVGTGSYIYNRPHLQITSSQKRLLYAGFGSVLFSFSSILLWAVLRSLLPNNVVLGSAAGLATSYALVKGGQSYLALVDSQISKN